MASGSPFDDLHIPVAPGQQVHAWWVPGTRMHGTAVLYFHGNGSAIESGRPPEAAILQRLGADLLVIDYRGYGSSSRGAATERKAMQAGARCTRRTSQTEAEQR
jgi:pimeloyl-ACP methyl ester carboxylesterase